MDIKQVYLREVRRKYRKLTREEEVELCDRARRGDQQAREVLFNSMLGFVVRFAMKYRHRLDFMDLVAAGHEGALRAVDGLDPSKGRLITTAFYWIRQSILRAIYENGVIWIPTDFVDGAHERNGTFTKDRLDEVKNLRFGIRSLDSPISKKRSDDTLGSFIDDESQPVLDRMIQQERREIVLSMIDRLPEKFKRIVLMRMDGKLLSEIGKEFGRTKEAVRLSLLQAIQMLQKMRPLEPQERTS